MNLFHAVQYLALVWWSEGGRLRRRLRLDALQAGNADRGGGSSSGGVLVYGVWAELAPADDRALWSITQTVALMHFWYDGFIWSRDAQAGHEAIHAFKVLQRGCMRIQRCLRSMVVALGVASAALVSSACSKSPQITAESMEDNWALTEQHEPGPSS